MTCLWVVEPGSGEEFLLADPTELLADAEPGELPAAERARRERAREGAVGIVGYATDSGGTRVVFALAGAAYVVDTAAGSGGPPRRLDTAEGIFDPRLSPDGSHVSYVVGDELHLVAVDGGVPGVGLASEDVDTVSWGSAEFIAGEEMGRTRGHWWSPDSSTLVVERADVAAVPVWHISDPAQPWNPPRPNRYPAAGTTNADVSLSYVGLDGERTAIRWDTDLLPYLVDVQWEEGHPLTLITSTRDQRRMMILEATADGECEVVHTLEDPEWVEIVGGTPRRTEEGWLSIVERDDTRALVAGGARISPPEHWVRDLVSADETGVLYTASTVPHEVQLFRIDTQGEVSAVGSPSAVVGATGSGELRVEVTATLSDATSYAVVTEAARVPIASHAATPAVAPAVELFESGPLRVPTAVLFPSGAIDGPLPILLDPYGGPHAQRILSSRNAFLASQWFADQGFCVVVADGRGTPGRGGGWERAVRGDLAAPVLADQVAALDAVIERYGDRVDPGRVGIRGWSFGGYLAALAVLSRPDRFHAGVAGAPVTEWRWYDTHYTERYLGHPDAEPDNYERTSLLPLASDLERPLLIIHGLADDNVVAAHSLQLSSALLAAGRPHEVLPLSGVTHMTPQEQVAENLLLLQVDFLRRSLR